MSMTVPAFGQEIPTIVGPGLVFVTATGILTPATIGTATATDSSGTTIPVTNDAPKAYPIGTTYVK